jgi:CHRD domain-containing protein
MQMVQPGSAIMAATMILALAPLVYAQGAARTESKPQTFKTRLSPVPVDVTTQAGTTGVGAATAVLTGTKLTVSGTFSGLQTPATIAQIHIGPRAIPGPVALDLTVTKATSGTLQGEFMLTPAQVDHLRRGRLYIQVHSEKAPEGNLRGWLLP